MNRTPPTGATSLVALPTIEPLQMFYMKRPILLTKLISYILPISAVNNLFRVIGLRQVVPATIQFQTYLMIVWNLLGAGPN